MININRNNYEEYLLYFHEGQLSTTDESLLLSFLDKNPDLKVELDFFENVKIIDKSIVYSNKNALKKTSILDELTNDNFDELCIAKIEGDFYKKELIRFEDFLKTSPRQKEFKLYELTKLSSDTSIIYKNKAKIKRQEKKALSLKRNYTLISAAASVIFLISLYLFIPSKMKEKNEFIVQDIPGIKTERKMTELKIENKKEEIKKSDIIKTLNRDIKVDLFTELSEEEKVEVEEKSVVRDYLQLADLRPLEITLDVDNPLEIKEVSLVDLDTNNTKEIDANKYMSVKEFLASTINKTVLNKENKNRIDFFDIAEAGVRGINKITGGKMKLERKYDKNGIPDKTEFNSRLIAFSTHIKKD